MLTNIAYAREFYPFTAAQLPRREGATLLAAGFSEVEMLGTWGATHTRKAYK